MPWWGWLIGFSVAAICATVVIVVLVMTSTMRVMSRDGDEGVGRRQRVEARSRPLWTYTRTTRSETPSSPQAGANLGPRREG